MWIMKQNKSEIINCNHIYVVGKRIIGFKGAYGEDHEELGEYINNEEAKIILNDIFLAIEHKENTFKMP